MSAHGRRRPGAGASHEEGNSERWLLTYADMITLLLALFVVLFAFSSINVKKFLELRLGLTSAFNPSAVTLSGGTGLLNQTSLASSPGSAASAVSSINTIQGRGSEGSGRASFSAPSSRELMDEIQRAIERAGLGKDAQVRLDARGVVIRILADRVFYASGSADLGPTGRQVVDLVANIIRPEPNSVVVEGFTDNIPVTGGPFTSNWELSAVRAADVVQQLNTSDGIEESRLSSEGFGDTQPVASNDTSVGRSLNRRIEVVVLNTGS